MKNKNTFFTGVIMILFFVALAFAACNKKSFTMNNVGELKEELKSSPQLFSGQAGQSWSVEGNKGTRIHFGPSSFRDQNGNTISSGTIDISLVEMPKAKDMVLNNVTTMSGSLVFLQSGGSVNLEVSQNGNPVMAGSGTGIDFRQDVASTDTMSLFQGGGQFSFDSAGGTISWFDLGVNPQSGTVQDPSNSLDYYVFNALSHFNYINCDKFYNDSRPKTRISISLSDVALSLYSASGFIILPEINAVIPIYQSDRNNLNTLALSGGLGIPIGMKATFVALAKVEGKYYFAKKENEALRANHTMSMALSEMSLEDIKNAITNL